jgi:hypothetical protein
MFKKIVIIALASTLASGCASVPMESLERTTTAKKFDPPSEGSSGLYIYRNTSFGGHLKGGVWVDGKCLGATAPSVFFYEEIEGDKSLNLSPISDFKLNPSETYLKKHGPQKGLNIQVKSGMNYFIQHNMNYLGDGIPSFKLVDEEQGKEEVSKLDMAAKVACKYSDSYKQKSRVYARMREMRLKEEASHSKDTRYNSNKPSLAEIGQVIKGVSEALASFNEGLKQHNKDTTNAYSYQPPALGYNSYMPSNEPSGYRSSFGNTYKYDLNRPLDRLHYNIDPKAKLRDRIDINPQRRIERNTGQYGGGVLNDNDNNSPKWNWVD